MIKCQFDSVCVGTGSYTSKGETVPYVMLLYGDRVIRVHHCTMAMSAGEVVSVPCELKITRNGNYFFVYLHPGADENNNSYEGVIKNGG